MEPTVEPAPFVPRERVHDRLAPAPAQGARLASSAGTPPPALSRRGFLATALTFAIAGPANASPRLVIGRQNTRIQPSGSLTPEQAWSLAEHIVRLHTSHEARLSEFSVFLVRVAGTGSMRPALGDGDVVIMETAPYDSLGLGDIVWWVDHERTSWGLDGTRGPLSVLHRITGGQPGAWITRGDNNTDADPNRMTESTYRARVCQVIHCRKPRV